MSNLDQRLAINEFVKLGSEMKSNKNSQYVGIKVDPLPTQRVHPLCTILRYPYLVTDPRKFLKATLAPINTNFVWGARAKTTQFIWSKFSENA